ncbi:MAG: DUF134 domain-containing protein [Actinomycetota bacterium]|nr:DUF134 domain-containing protein [Actinomycetota bacterium]
MPRPVKSRYVQGEPPAKYFKPRGIPLSDLEEINLTVEELEALRLAEIEGLYQEGISERMGVSRQTVQRILNNARRKVACALTEGNALRIEGGNYLLRPGGPSHVTPGKGGQSKRGWGGGRGRS